MSNVLILCPILKCFCEKINIIEICSNHSILLLQNLSQDLEELYKDWFDGEKLFLHFGDNLWVIDVHIKNGKCMLGKGWYDFSQINNLKEGNTLVLYRLPGSETNSVKACIFEHTDEGLDESKGKTKYSI